MSSDSYRKILRSTSIIGGASVINILIGLVRIKVAALLLGPAGIGLIGLFNNLIATAANVAALGTGTVGTRQIAEAAGRGDAHEMAIARRALFWSALILATTGAFGFWLLRDAFAVHILNQPKLSNEVGWLAVGVGLTVASGSQGALLNGLRRIGDLARVSVYSAALSTVFGVAALLLWHEDGLLVFLLSTPLASFILGHFYVSRLPNPHESRIPLHLITQQWKRMACLGMFFMLAGLAATVGQLAVRTLVQQQLKVEGLGYLEAAWAISLTYIGIVLRSMGTDYYPRLTAVIHDPAAVNKLVNEQTEIALLLAAPVFLALLGLAPWIIELLYSSRFADAALILRWQILGDILKVASWPLGFILLAAGQGRAFLLSETFATFVFVASAWLSLPYFGIQAIGIANLVMYGAYLPTVYWLARRRTGFRWQAGVLLQLILLFIASTLVNVATSEHHWAGAILGIGGALIFGFYALKRLVHITELAGPLSRLANTFRSTRVK